MAEDEAAGERPHIIRTGRLEAFSDGVFAIAITLLVLEIAVPAGSEEDLLAAILGQWPVYLAYFVSFASIGAIWLAHSAITEYLRHVDSIFVRLNLLLLLVVAFLPFPTRLIGEFVGEREPERVAVTIYGITLLLASVLVSVLWRHAVTQGLLRPDADDEEIQVVTKRLTPGMAGYVVIIVIGLFVPIVAVFGYLAIALFYLVPFGALRRGAARP